jgi:predicted CXXCH cytochrome family protein
MRHRIALAIFIVAGVLLMVSPALAYDEVDSGDACDDCHAGFYDRQGPHGGYTTSTTKCQTCHSVHAAPPGGDMLLPGSTISATCFTCHDGTSTNGQGVYGAIEAQGITPASRHRVETTDIVPGGDPVTGGSKSYVFGGLGGTLSCGDCHSPHDASTVNAFTGDRWRSEDASQFVSNRLLKNRPNGIGYDIVEYDSDWCGACHRGRLTFGSAVENHPVESTAVAGYHYYDSVVRTGDVAGTLGQHNGGYIMDTPLEGTGNEGHYPICQQCHEDTRDVESGFAITSPDGTPTASTDNPRFQNFPHEAVNEYLLVETDDDLCLGNCHGLLP